MRKALLGVMAMGLLSGPPVTVATEPAQQPSGADSFQEMVEDLSLPQPPVRAITRGPKFHWFGYYDKFQFDPSGRYVLSMQVDFEHRMPEPGEAIQVGMIDLADGDRWIELGASRAWCWQQGCMLQWRPGSDAEALWNDREGDQFVTRILNVKTGEKRTVPMAINHVAPCGKWAVTTDFRRIFDIRPSYGYAGLADPFRDEPAPEQSGVWLVDLDSGQTKLVVSLAELAAIPYQGAKEGDKHRVYHCMWNNDGSRFLFYNRWAGGTRVFTAAADGTDLRLLSASGASHYTWRDPQHAVIWAGAYRLYKDDGSGEPKETILDAPNGHQTFVPGTDNEWMLTDTYPQKDTREQIVYLFHVSTGKLYPLGRFHSPREYGGFWRVDAHPRVSRDGTQVVIDATHGDEGRQQYLIEIGHIVHGANAEKQAGPPYIDPEQAPADFHLQGEYIGTVERDGQVSKYGVQVVAVDAGQFRAVGYPGGLPGDGWNGQERTVADGRLRDGTVRFTLQAADIVAELKDGQITVFDTEGKSIGRLEKVYRESPTLGAEPPEGAVVLFDGTGADAFPGARMTEDGLLEQGATSERTFGRHRIHLEFRTPFWAEGRGNSGFYAQGRYEVQILDSFGQAPTPNGCGGIYGVASPKLNMSFPPLSWQTFDIDFTPAKFDNGKKTENARMTVRHNGVLIHENTEIPDATRSAILEEGAGPGPVYLQDHRNPVRFRNIWVVPHD